MAGTRRFASYGPWATLLVVASIVVLAMPGWAWARYEPPDVPGLSIAEAEKTLTDWDSTVVITYQPALEKLPAGTDVSTVTVTRFGLTVGVELVPPRAERVRTAGAAL